MRRRRAGAFLKRSAAGANFAGWALPPGADLDRKRCLAGRSLSGGAFRWRARVCQAGRSAGGPEFVRRGGRQ
jgi:hypothetical protein